jgi:paraquat-inducible protein B
MSKKSNPTLIGGFVVGAVLLIALAFSILGGSELLQQRLQYVTYFEGSVKGLRVGANVLFRGVRIGYVTDISLIGDAETFEFVTPVTIRILPDALTITRDGRAIGDASRVPVRIEELIEAGLRSQLGVESFVTGQLLVELDLKPNSELVFRGINPPYQEIPSVSSEIREVLASLQGWFEEFSENVDVGELGRSLQSALVGLEQLTNSEDLRKAIAGFDRLVNSDDAQSLAGDLRTTIADARLAVDEFRGAVNGLQENFGPLGAELSSTLQTLDDTLLDGQQIINAAAGQIADDSEIAVELSRTLADLREAARALRVFLEFLERNPESLLRGKRKQKE